jgi:F-type H+-transporting ATPase subunit delta
MGSATREALSNVRAALDVQSGRADLQVADELFSAERLLAANPAVRSAIADPTAAPEARAQLARQIFASRVSGSTAEVLVAIAGQRWSQGSDVLAALEELGIRVAAQSAPAETNVENELFVVQAAITSDANLDCWTARRRRRPRRSCVSSCYSPGDAASVNRYGTRHPSWPTRAVRRSRR